MSLKIDDLQIGSVVRLASGSPKMLVTAFVNAHGARPAGTGTHVRVVLWSDRLGFVERLLEPRLLVFPRVAEPAAEGGE